MTPPAISATARGVERAGHFVREPHRFADRQLWFTRRVAQKCGRRVRQLHGGHERRINGSWRLRRSPFRPHARYVASFATSQARTPIVRYFAYRSRLAGSLLSAVVAASGCGKDSPQATTQPPATTQPAAPVPSYTISGVVIEDTPTGQRPAAGVNIVVRSDRIVVTQSGADGRYSATVWGDNLSYIAPVLSEAYLSPCPSGTAWPLSTNPNRTFDLHVISKNVLSTTGVPDSYPRTALYVTGTVVEATPDGPRPVAGALVTLGKEWYDIYSTTLSDSLGRYVICTSPPGSGTDQETPLTVSKDGYDPATLLVLLGFNPDVSVELVREP